MDEAPWYKHAHVWMGVSALCVATIIFWYFIQDIVETDPEKRELDHVDDHGSTS